MKKKDVNEQFVTCMNDYKEDFYRLAFSYVKNQEDCIGYRPGINKKSTYYYYYYYLLTGSA